MFFSKDEAIEFIRDNDVKFIKLSFCDPFGVLKNISLLASRAEEVFENGFRFDASFIESFGGPDVADLLLFPIPETMTLLPWRPSRGRVARVFCRICNIDGTPFALDFRELLKGAVARAQQQGVLLNIKAECEFYLLKCDENGQPTNIPCDQAGYLDANPADKGENVRRDICLTLEEMGISPESSHHDAGPGQNEIDFGFGSPTVSADDVLTFRNVVSSVSANYGLWATFEPKPIQYKPGNGFHINFSVLDSALTPSAALGQAFMAGILSHIRELTVFLNPTEGSYQRLGTFKSPSRIGYSARSHQQLITLRLRPEAENELGSRFKLRSADSSSNPYLVYTLLIYAGLDGISRSLTLPPELDVDRFASLSDAAEALPTLPQTLGEAAALACGNEFVRSALGNELTERLLDIYTNSGR